MAETLVGTTRPRSHVDAIRALVRLFSSHRELTWELTRRELSERYAGQVLGTLWAIGHPLVMIAVYLFVFGVVFEARVSPGKSLGAESGGYAVYLLSALIPWLAIQESMSKGATVLVQNSSLVKQVVFPIEILPIKGVLASLLTQAVMTVAFLAYAATWAGAFKPTWLLLPLLWLCQFLAMCGICFVLSAVGAFFRDVKDLVQLLSVTGLYLMPIVYLPDWVPDAIRPILYLNPFSYMTWCFQDALYFGHIAHPIAWVVFPACSVLVLYLGYRLFGYLKIQVGNFL